MWVEMLVASVRLSVLNATCCEQEPLLSSPTKWSGLIRAFEFSSLPDSSDIELLVKILQTSGQLLLRLNLQSKIE